MVLYLIQVYTTLELNLLSQTNRFSSECRPTVLRTIYPPAGSKCPLHWETCHPKRGTSTVGHLVGVACPNSTRLLAQQHCLARGTGGKKAYDEPFHRSLCSMPEPWARFPHFLFFNPTLLASFYLVFRSPSYVLRVFTL